MGEIKQTMRDTITHLSCFWKYERYFVKRQLKHAQLENCEKYCLNHHQRLIHFPMKEEYISPDCGINLGSAEHSIT